MNTHRQPKECQARKKVKSIDPSFLTTRQKPCKADKAELMKKNSRGVLSKKEALFTAPDAATGSFIQEYYNEKGDLIRFAAAKVPLYVTTEMLDFIFIDYIKEDSLAVAEIIARGKPLTDEDKVIIMSRKSEGRTVLEKFSKPTELFALDGGAEPMMVKDFFLKPEGLKGQDRGLSAALTRKLSDRQDAVLKQFGSTIGPYIKTT